MNFSSQLGGQEQQNIEWWKLFLALWIMIIPFLSCEPFVPLSMSWSCLRRPFQVSRMEVVKFISGWIAVAFSSFGCFESVGSGEKGASTFDVAPSFSINLMIDFAVFFNRDRWFIPFFASTGCQATTKASDPYPVRLQSYCKHWISKMMAQMLASTDNAWRGEGSAVNRFGMNLKALWRGSEKLFVWSSSTNPRKRFWILGYNLDVAVFRWWRYEWPGRNYRDLSVKHHPDKTQDPQIARDWSLYQVDFGSFSLCIKSVGTHIR